MTAALVEPVVENPKTAVESREPMSLSPVVSARMSPAGAEASFTDTHPLAPVFVIGGMALIGALAIVGSILMWLALRYSGVLAP